MPGMEGTGDFGIQLVILALATLVSAGVLLRGRFGDSESSASNAPRMLAGVVLVAALVGGYLTWSASVERRESRRRLEAEIPTALTSQRDALASNYVTSDRCISCHPDQYSSWHDSYHRTMTQKASQEAILAPWDGQQLEARGRAYALERRGEEYWVEMADPDWEQDRLAAGKRPEAVRNPPRVWKRVVMTTGSHHMQTYWVASEEDGRLFNLPWLWLTGDQRWIPREDGFIRPPDGHRTFDVWHGACIECHSVGGEKTRTEDGAWAPEAAELGISCEACHGPAEAHIEANQNPARRYLERADEAPDPTIVNPARLPAEASSQVCGQCHGMNVFKGYVRADGTRYQPGEDLRATRIIMRTTENARAEADHPDPDRQRDHKHLEQLIAQEMARDDTFLRDRFWPDGMVRVSGREHNSFIESACVRGGEITCLTCHSMHESDPDDQLKAAANPSLDPIAADAVCTSCHPSHGQDVEAHTHHPAESPGSRCYNCHMPHTVYGLLKSIRSHWIDSPSAASTVATGRPNACGLCHLDRPLGWTAERLEAWYGQPVPTLSKDEREVASGVRWALTGNAQQRALAAWHMGWPDAQGASADADWKGFFLGHLLDDPYPAVRYIAARALDTVDGPEPLAYDFLDDARTRAAARAREMDRYAPRGGASRPDPALLRAMNGGLDRARFDRLAAERNDETMDLRE